MVTHDQELARRARRNIRITCWMVRLDNVTASTGRKLTGWQGTLPVFSYYLRLALKSLRNSVLSSLIVTALGLGIGAFMTTYTVYYLMSGNPIPHKSKQLFAVQMDNWDPNNPAPTESARDVQPQLTWRDANYLVNAQTQPNNPVAIIHSTFVVVFPTTAMPRHFKPRQGLQPQVFSQCLMCRFFMARRGRLWRTIAGARSPLLAGN